MSLLSCTYTQLNNNICSDTILQNVYELSFFYHYSLDFQWLVPIKKLTMSIKINFLVIFIVILTIFVKTVPAPGSKYVFFKYFYYFESLRHM